MSLTDSLPIYTTRPHGKNGSTCEWSCSAWAVLLAGFLVWLNVVAWGVIGLVYAVKVIA